MNYDSVGEAHSIYRAAVQHCLDNDINFWEYKREYLECDHAHREPMRWEISNGVVRVALVCQICGDKHTAGVKKADYDVEKLTCFSDEIGSRYKGVVERWRHVVQAEYQKKWQEDNQQQSKEWWARYNKYLKSDKWRIKREAVLKRDNYLCQACLHRTASQVHHLTYKHVLDEPLFDLVSICEPCHRKLHNHD
jgi:hypothetical protein